jgi:simple sugar transport system ATP-binding protein
LKEKRLLATLLSARNIYKSFGGVHALTDVSFTCAPSEIHCLVGENGSGKSTLVKILSGVHTPDTGEIELNGNSYSKMSVSIAIHEGIQVIYQDLSLFSHMSVAENIATNKLITQNKKVINWKEIYSIAEEQLVKVNVSIDPKSPVEKLSISNQQLIAICRALSLDAKILFMDEPTTALTKKEVDKLLSIVVDLKKTNMSVVFISHKLDEIMKIADNVTIFRDGRKIGDFLNTEIDEKKLIFYMTGKNIEYKKYKRTNKEDQPILDVKNLTRQPNYKEICFSLKKGDILGITGLLGSGRTELAYTLFGLNPPDSGTIILRNKEFNPKSPSEAICEHVSLLPENRQTQGAYINKSIADNVSASVLEKITNKFGILKRKVQKKIAQDVIAQLRIKAKDISANISELSGGNQQKVVLGKWIETDPDVLILDSPTVGVDIGSKSEIYDYIQMLAHNGLGVILISDEIPELIANCNKILILQDGIIVGRIDENQIDSDDLYEKIKFFMNLQPDKKIAYSGKINMFGDTKCT